MINDIKIREHFKLSEFQSGDSQEVKIDSEQIEKLEKLRERIGQPIKINSGYRTPEHNEAVGGSYKSQHMKGIAVDISLPAGMTVDELAAIAEAVGFDGIVSITHLYILTYGAITRAGTKENERRMIRMNTILKIGNVLWATAIVWLPVVLWIAKKKIPIVDRYLRNGLVIVENIDDAIEMALLEFPNNVMLKTADDICNRVLEILKKAGYTVNKNNEPKIETRVKGQLNRKDGLSIDWNTGEIKIDYQKAF